MMKISEKLCDFVREVETGLKPVSTSSMKFYSHSFPFLPLWRGTWGRAFFASLR